MNPYLEAIPKLLGWDEFFANLRSLPPIPYDLERMSASDRRMQLAALTGFFYPMKYMYVIYDMLHRAITTTYSTKTTLDSIRQINALHQGSPTGNFQHRIYSISADSSSILGVPGIGKTSTVKRCLDLLPQVIEHTEYNGKPFYTKQISHLMVECPSDCSVKALVFNIAMAIDRAIGSEYFDRMAKIRSMSASVLANQIKIICMNHHVGLIVIDEIQNAVTTAERNRQMKPLIRFLVELTNDTNTSVCFVGTPIAEDLFCSQEHLKRRTRGLRLLPLKPGGAYREFLSTLWVYQYTAHNVELADSLANRLYDYSAGIPAYIVKLFMEAQAQAIMDGSERINAGILKQTVERLAIRVPKVFSGGTYISDFTVSENPVDLPVESHSERPVCPQEVSEEKVVAPRPYAVPRGRRRVVRESADLIELFKKAKAADEMVKAIERLELREDGA